MPFVEWFTENILNEYTSQPIFYFTGEITQQHADHCGQCSTYATHVVLRVDSRNIRWNGLGLSFYDAPQAGFFSVAWPINLNDNNCSVILKRHWSVLSINSAQSLISSDRQHKSHMTTWFFVLTCLSHDISLSVYVIMMAADVLLHNLNQTSRNSPAESAMNETTMLMNHVTQYTYRDEWITKYISIQTLKRCICVQGPLLLTWFNFNPSMYK